MARFPSIRKFQRNASRHYHLFMADTPVTELPDWLASPRLLLLSICGAAAAVMLIGGNPLEKAEMSWLDAVLRSRHPLALTPEVDPRIAHLDITRQEIELLATPQSEYENAANVIRAVAERGARVVAFDIVFARGDSAAAQPILRAIADARDQGCLVVLSEALLEVAGSGEAERVRSFPFQDRHSPAGLTNIEPDSDGVFRHYALVHRTKDQPEPSLALAAYWAWRSVDLGSVTAPQPQVLRWDELSPDGKSVESVSATAEPMLLNFRSDWSDQGAAAFPHYHLANLPAITPESPRPLAGKVILVSYVAAGITDVGATAIGLNQPCALLHSTALNDFIQKRSLSRSPRGVDAAALIIGLLFGGWLGARFQRLRGLLAIWLAGLVALAALSGALICFWEIVPAAVATATVWTVFVAADVGRRSALNFSKRLQFKTRTDPYFSPGVLDLIGDNPERLEQGTREIAVLLTDLRNSVSLTTLLQDDGMLSLLNRVFEVEIRAVFDKTGSIEKPVGDQFLAYWGTPVRVPLKDAATRALAATFELIKGLDRLGLHLDDRTRQLFEYGVALHAGEALMAKIGSNQFLHYGVTGDLINATARIESHTKFLGVNLLVSREFLVQIEPRPPARLLDDVILKGRSTAIKLYEVRQPRSPANFDALAAQYAEAFSLYQKGSFSEAALLFRALAPDPPTRGVAADPPSRALAERCETLADDPPAEWNGVYQMETK